MNKKELYHFLPSLVFLIVLGILALLLFFGPDKDYSVNEKRYLAERRRSASPTSSRARPRRSWRNSPPTRSPAGISSWA